tara:strand:- start:301 stop:465 length:165 start_codon:yes stop_codon:yes gene_type:complete
VGNKKAFALRMDEKMLAAVEKWAADEFRSTNGQIEFLLSEALKKAGRAPKPKKQ